MIMYHLGPQLGVWIMQVSTFSSVLINRFHCMYIIMIIKIIIASFHDGDIKIMITQSLTIAHSLFSKQLTANCCKVRNIPLWIAMCSNWI